MCVSLPTLDIWCAARWRVLYEAVLDVEESAIKELCALTACIPIEST
jgi:hypothetical protein